MQTLTTEEGEYPEKKKLLIQENKNKNQISIKKKDDTKKPQPL